MRVQAVRRHVTGAAAEVIDAGIAAALLILVGAQLADENVAGSLLTYLAFAPAITLPIALRRRAPLSIAAFISLAVIGQALLSEPAITFGEFLATMLATYSVAAHRDLPNAALGALLVTAAVGIHTLQQGGPYPPFEWVYSVVYFGGAFAAGRAVRLRSGRTAAVEERAARLEREQADRERAAAEAERARMARDLHDVVAHSVGVMVVQAGAARIAVDGSPEDARSAIERVEDTGRQTIAELRRLLGILRTDEAPAERAPQPGLASIGGLIDEVRNAGVPIELRLEGARRPLAPGVELAAYRIVQEALTNVLKHAGTAHATVAVRFGAHELQLEIANDGSVAPNPGGSGHGLIGMRERAALYGGQVEAGALAGGGFRVWASLPLATMKND